MRRLDDIRSSNQSIQPKRQPVRQLKQQQHINRPKRTPHTFKRASFFKLIKSPFLFIWRQKIIILSTALIIIIGIGAILLLKNTNINNKKEQQNTDHKLSDAEKLKQIVITDDTKLAVNFTFNLKMIINNQLQAIPAGYGKTENEKLIFNTDTSTGDIHVESPKKESYTLNNFFVLWGSQFNSSCLLNHCLGGSGSLTMTVNGDINPEFGDYVIEENDQIVITYNDAPLP